MFAVAGFAVGMLLLGYFQGYVHGAAGAITGVLADANRLGGNLDTQLRHLRGSLSQHVGQLDIEVSEKPFGMHMRRGSLVVEEVFPGFPAQKLGVRPGCEIQEIAGEKVKQGTWLDTFSKLPTPFKMSFNCPPHFSRGHGPLSDDKHNYRVLVIKKPFGMNVQVNTVPRVVEVLAGSPAEAAGVKRGFVLTAVQDQPVDAETWHDAWSKVTLPATLTFDTDRPVSKDNPFFDEKSGDVVVPSSAAPANLPEGWEEDEPVDGFDDVSVSVKELPFGMHVDAPPGKLPIVKAVVAGLPAEAQGIKAGDILIKVAGHRVDASTWFGVFQHAVPPFGLRFRRPHVFDSSKSSRVPLPVMPTVGEMSVTVEERPFGMKVKKGSNTVQEVFPKTPAQKLGVRKGCEIHQIAGKEVSQGNWMELFQHTPLPFNLKLYCHKKASSSKKSPETGHGPLSEDEHNFKVFVKERPFGMNVQSNVVPRVVEVLPGYPAEAAGVKAGFVLTAINDQKVDADSWFDIWQEAPVGTVLTFDTNMPLNPNNPFVHDEDNLKKLIDEEHVKEGFSDFRAAVKKLPFGFEVSAPHGNRPTVKRIVKGSPAEAAGVKVGDVLVEVAGLPVTTASWFKAFQQAVPPFGVHFRRPDPKDQPDSSSQASS